MVLNKLREARQLLGEAEDEANMGTGLMTREIKDQLDSLIERTENIENGRND